MTNTEYYIDSIAGEFFEGIEFDKDEYGVFCESTNDHCYFYGSYQACELFIKNK